MLTPQDILEELKKVKYPGFSRDIVSFGLIKDIEIGSTGVNVILTPTTANDDVLQQIRVDVEATVAAMPGVTSVQVSMTAPVAPQRRMQSGPAGIPGVAHIVAVASGKGGVGKSTVAVNLALALSRLGHRVGLMDADVYGPSVAKMLGIVERPITNEEKRITPISKFGIKVVSMGMFIEERTPVVWRGPMISKLLTQFFRDVDWGDLDFLILDLPPGTGDAQLTITQQVPLSGGVIVTTPQDVALEDVKRGVTMFQQVRAPVLGVIENMSFHMCSHCGKRSEPFGHGGGTVMAEQFGLALLGEVPLVRAIRETADAGTPIVVAQPDHPQSVALMAIAERVAEAAKAQASAALPTIH